MDPVGHRDSDMQSWVEENWKTIRCWAGGAQALALTAYNAIATVRGRPQNVWGIVNDAIVAGTYLSDCAIENPEVEQYFPESSEECQCVTAGGQLWAEVTIDGEKSKESFGGKSQAMEVLETEYDNDGDSICQYSTASGDYNFAEVQRPQGAETFAVYWYISPAPGSTCCGNPPVLIDEPEAPAPFFIPQYTDQDNDETCTREVTLVDSEVDHRGVLWNKYLVGAGTCNPYLHESFCYWESRTGVFFPNKCSDPLPFPPYAPPEFELSGLNPVSYRLHVPCSWDEQQGGFTDWVDYNIEGTQDGILGLARRIDGIAYLLDRATQFPYRECNVQPEVEGDWVTIAWISDEPSSDSPLRLRKRTRYRSKSNRDSKQLQQYYKDFQWDAGPVCVKHKGAFWGYPQVWASSVDEGKRVLRHLAGEAGLDPDQVGRWEVGSSRNPRIGQTGRMGVRRLEGMPWVSRRDGSNMLPM